MHKLIKMTVVALVSSFCCSVANASSGDVAIKNGAMQWQNGQQVALFGVNYSTPFAYAYRSLNKLGIDHKTAIDMDVDHFARLGLDAYRIHMWDREISDQQGNLLENQHLELFDYLLKKLAEHDIKVIITPIAWWGSGYPEPDPQEPGFAALYTKAEMNQQPKAVKAQQNYLQQLFRHKNPYTGLTYGQDPNIIAIEIFNEPRHPGDLADSAAYVEKLIATIRGENINKPLFYNISEQGNNQPFAKALCGTSIDGIAYQWYPTGLVHNNALQTNMLPAVSQYTNPFANTRGCADKAKMVYEFDAADVTKSVMYPAMARSFKAAGFQWATQFAYDSAVLAQTNSNYNTHYLNLLYTPSKAISLMIAGEVFRTLPLNSDTGSYPSNNQFADVTLDYHQDLAVLNNAEHFYYTHSTQATPKDIEQLQHIAGVGSSSMVDYQGSGSYFVDKVKPGVWQLEVYPDLQAIEDPHQNSSLHREVGRLYINNQTMQIDLAELGPRFYIQPVDSSRQNRQANKGEFKVRPGIYLLSNKPLSNTEQVTALDTHYYLPAIKTEELLVHHQPQRQFNLADKLSFSAQVGTSTPVDKVELMIRYHGDSEFSALPMQLEQGNRYEVNLTKDKNWSKGGLLEYAITVTQTGVKTTFPGAASGTPTDWDFVAKQPYWQTGLRPAGAPVTLFDPAQDTNNLLYPKDARSKWEYVSGQQGDELALKLSSDAIKTDLPNPLVRIMPSMDNSLKDRNLTGYNTLAVKVRAYDKAEYVHISLLDKNGLAYGTVVKVDPNWHYVLIPLNKMQAVDTIQPQVYPTFMPARIEPSESTNHLPLTELDLLQGLQLAFDAKSYQGSQHKGWHGIELSEVSLIQD
ncbi:hypothetical protein [Neptunicella sp.]|uniref:hypothetical protein n=1 Tax=Neptunicella sp. TaxID=2125986 RepID=UPI003F68F0FC